MKRSETAMRAKATLWTAVALAAALATPAQAGFWALPLKAEVDLVENVVVGKLARIEPARLEYEGRMAFSRGAIAVRETLKGVPSTDGLWSPATRNVSSARDAGHVDIARRGPAGLEGASGV